MEISALNTANLSPVKAEALSRVAQGRVTREDAGEGRKAASQVRQDQAEQSRADALRAAREAQRKAELQAPAAGQIRFEEDEGTRVMRVMDRKDVLIYQVPTKGELALIRAEEAAARRMLVRA